MQTWIELNPQNLRQNFQTFSKIVGHEKVVPVLKSNAYGHGLQQIYEILKSENPAWLAVNYVEEGISLRGFGFSGRILVVGPFLPNQQILAQQNKLEMLLGHREGLDAWKVSTTKPDIHIEFDTGMSRQGFNPESGASIARELLAYKDRVRGVCMHFANVEDVTEHDYARLQLERFEVAKSAFISNNYKIIAHAASSASTLILTDSRLDMMRIGISTYGFWPSQATKISYKQLHGDTLNLSPVLSWRTIITSLNDVTQGQFIGYGCTFKARHNMKLAVLPVGYFEGYPRSASGSQAYVLIRGERCPIVGRICMNMMMVDVTDLIQVVKVGDIATLIGQDGSEKIAASDVAAWSNTIHYELVSRLNPEIDRRICG